MSKAAPKSGSGQAGTRGTARSASASHSAATSTSRASRARRVGLGSIARSASENVRENPFAAIAGAVAVSAGLALLLPSSRRETELMGEVADKIGDATRDIVDGAVESGRSQVEALAQTALAEVGGALVESVVSGKVLAGGEAKTS